MALTAIIKTIESLLNAKRQNNSNVCTAQSGSIERYRGAVFLCISNLSNHETKSQNSNLSGYRSCYNSRKYVVFSIYLLIMAYSEKEIKELFEKIVLRIEDGEPLRRILKDKTMPSTSTFYIWVDNDAIKSKRYARATSIRADVIFDEMFDIADDGTNDFESVDIGDGIKVQKLNSEHIQRSKLRIDTRKWALSKMNPKKYGEKIDVTTDGEKVNNNFYFTADDFAE